MHSLKNAPNSERFATKLRNVNNEFNKKTDCLHIFLLRKTSPFSVEQIQAQIKIGCNGVIKQLGKHKLL